MCQVHFTLVLFEGKPFAVLMFLFVVFILSDREVKRGRIKASKGTARSS